MQDKPCVQFELIFSEVGLLWISWRLLLAWRNAPGKLFSYPEKTPKTLVRRQRTITMSLRKKKIVTHIQTPGKNKLWSLQTLEWTFFLMGAEANMELLCEYYMLLQSPASPMMSLINKKSAETRTESICYWLDLSITYIHLYLLVFLPLSQQRLIRKIP